MWPSLRETGSKIVIPTGDTNSTDGEGVSRDACYTHLRGRFPRQMDRAQRLLADSAEFREACDDYEECAGILARLCGSLALQRR